MSKDKCDVFLSCCRCSEMAHGVWVCDSILRCDATMCIHFFCWENANIFFTVQDDFFLVFILLRQKWLYVS